MKSIKIAAFAVLAAVLLVGCGEQSVSETSGSSVESTTSSSSSVESSSEPSSTSGGQSSSSSEVADNQDILKSNQSSQGDSSTSDTSSSEPTSDTHEPTSQPTSSSSNSKPTGDTSTPTTSKPTSSSSQPNTSTPTSPYWNPNAPGNTPGKYKDSYIDVAGNLHCKYENMPRDSYGYPVESYYTETGMYVMTKAESDKADEDARRVLNGEHGDDGLTDDQIRDIWGDLLN